MCFSATASFALAGVILPTGAYAVARANRFDRRWLGFALFPLAFGVQQLFEGAVWLGIGSQDEELIARASRGFLFFSHFFWLAWVPFSAWAIESDPVRRRIMAALTAVGFAYGLSIFLPAATRPDGLRIEVIQHSLEYHTYLIYEGVISRTILRLFYAAIVVSALLLSSSSRIRLFGILILVSLGFTYLFFAYAFISVWCFFAAALSAYLVWAIPRAATDGRAQRI